ncbi:class I SAM-dependent methyltransferase [Conexibacter woesei]|uniref:class I SAM-dependent methyltransferase n=1 Tax=Conexibacter woesei TaxID=191495 RepID=UPI0004158EEF|nr:methyltransferase domain-containing protein [Conexibacter woesei]
MADVITKLRASLGEQLSVLRGVPVADLPPALLDVAIERFDVGQDVDLLLPSDWEQLRHEEGGAGRPLPFWAHPWPAGLALAEYLAQWPPPDGYRFLELGCGLALPSIVAARLGATVLATDGVEDAIAFATHNFALNDTFAEVARIDWAVDGDALVARGPFDVVLAADVLYNKDNVAAALELWPRLLGPDSHLLLADPRRAGLRDFMLGARGTLEVVNLEELDDPVTLVHLKLMRH